MSEAVFSQHFGSTAVSIERGAGDTLYVRSPQSLPDYPNKLTERLHLWAEHAPERTFLAERTPADGWRRLSYGEALPQVRALAQALLERRLSPERPLLILSDNSVDHALLGLAAQYAGVPYAPISPAYSLVSSDYAKLRHVIDLLTPGLVYAADGTQFGAAIAATVADDVEVVVSANAPAHRRATLLSELAVTAPTPALDAAHEGVGPDTIAKFLFTSGSTAMPKAVVNTQRMLCSNQETLRTVFAFLAEEPPVLLDWLPWNHTFGGNHNFNMALYNGGSLYIDDGRPTPAGIVNTVRNLREIAPTLYFNVPKGFEALIPHLQEDAALRDRFFSRLQGMFCAGAGIADHVWDALDALAGQSRGQSVPLLTGFGATETAPAALWTPPGTVRGGAVGIPCPGVELKLVPIGDRLEARLRGPGVTPGYWRQPEATRKAFDEEGFYCLGDALRFVDPAQPEAGLHFDGRIAEEFKLNTGVWVAVGRLRSQLVKQFAPHIRDAVIAGENRGYLSAILIPSPDHFARLCPGFAAAPGGTVADARVREHLRQGLRQLQASATGSSTRIERLAVLASPLSLDAGEVTDKGSVNQRALLRSRQALVEALYAPEPPEWVIDAGEE